MSTLFLNGLMPERHDIFIRRLATQYTLTGTRLTPFMTDPTLNIIDFHDDAKLMQSPLAHGLEDRLNEQTRILAENLAADAVVSPIGPAADWQLSAMEIEETIRPRVANMLVQEVRFREFLQRHPVDMVISGSDYGSHARVIARLARGMGIPTLDLEHGFFFNHITPEYSRQRGKMPIFFTSEYVNLDNELEKDLVARDLAPFPDQGTKFLGLGTPISSVASASVTRDKALDTLGLDGHKTQVLLVGSWNEARTVQRLVRGQVEMLDTFEDIFSSLAKREFCHRMQLTIKLHPADARPDVFPGVKAGLEQMAARCGLPQPLIKTDRLPEVLAAADVVLALGYSSVLYDAFLLEKPTVVVFPPFQVYSDRPGWRSDSTMPQRAGVSVAATTGDEAWQEAEAFLEPARREKFATDHAAFSEKYGLRKYTVEEKCERVMGWIASHLRPQ